MRVLHVEGGRNLYGGALQVRYLLEGLAARGVDNLLACPSGSELAAAARPFARVYAMPMGGDLDLALIWRLKRLIEDRRPDLVHLHSRIGADVLGGIAARLCAVPAVHSRRQDNPEARWMVRLKYRLHRRVIAISQGIGQVLLSEGLPASKLACVRSAVDAAVFDRPCDPDWFRREFELPEGARAIAVVAQLIERKGHGYLLEALPELIAQFAGLRVLFFGKGPLEARLRRQILARGLDGRVVLAGFRHDLPRILPCLELLVHPAVREGLGVSLLQAASAAVPIVACDAGGMPEAVRDRVNGLLVPPADVGALRQAIRTLLADGAMARRMGQAGRELMRREFSIDVMVDGNLRIYQQVLQEAAVG